MSYINPYKVLGVSPSSTLDEIRNAFKQLVLIYHPDRGGNKSDFDLIKQSYNAIYKLYKKNKSYQERANMNKGQFMNKYNDVDNVLSKQKNIFDNGKINTKIFNRMFDEYKVETPSQKGYGDYMVKSSKSREDIDILKKQKLQKKKREVVRYKEPQPVSTLSQNYEVLGEDGENFSNKHINRNMNFTDYMEAHDDEEVGQEPETNRKEYKNVDELIQDRSNINYKMNEDEKREYEKKQKQLNDFEQSRRMRFQRQEEIAARQFIRINTAIGYH
jgi:curved DNA-binding protein CbpA